MSPIPRWLGAVTALAVAAACGNESVAPSPTTSLVEVTPPAGATEVARDGAIIVRFSGPMGMGMENYVDLHRGTIDGPVVPMSCSWSADRSTLTCGLDVPLEERADYTLHMGGGMVDANGHQVMMEQPGMGMGGRAVTSGMMGGTHSGQPITMMGPGWRDADGHLGLMFGFTTS